MYPDVGFISISPYLSIYLSMFVVNIFYLAWTWNGLADYDEIWQAEPLWALVVHLEKLVSKPFRRLPTGD